MAKLTLNDIDSGYASVAALNANFTAIETTVENTLSRDGTSPNQMLSNLDMNGYFIINQANPVPIEGFTWLGDWATGTLYSVGDIVFEASTGGAYIAVIAHTSITFSTDLSSGKWQVFATSSLPSHSGATGKFLQSNGTSADWEVPDALEVSITQSGANAAARTVGEKLKETFSDSDFSTDADALVEAAASNKTIHVYSTATPAGSVGKNILWEYENEGVSKNILQFSGAVGGNFYDYDCRANKVLVAQIDEDQSSISGGGMRDTLFINTVDNDTSNYTSVGQKVTNGIRVYTNGAYSSGAFVPQYKDLIGGDFFAIGDVRWDHRGCSGVVAGAVQYGSGIASNEFDVHNPVDSPMHSTSMAALQAIVRSRHSDEDSTHLSRGLYVTCNGKRISSGIQMISDTSSGYSSHYKRTIDMVGATVTDCAIYMPQSASGSVGTIIVYDPNDYSQFYRSTDQFVWVTNASIKFSTNPYGISVGSATNSAKTRLFIDPSTTAASHLQLYPGATPSAPNNGEIWFDGTDIKMAIGGTIKTFTLT